MVKKSKQTSMGFDTIKFNDTLSYLKRDMISPHLVKPEQLDDVSVDLEYNVLISLNNGKRLSISSDVCIKYLFSIFGINSFIRDQFINYTEEYHTSLIKSFIMKNIGSLVFFYNEAVHSDVCDVAGVKGLFNKDLSSLNDINEESINVINKIIRLCDNESYSIVNLNYTDLSQPKLRLIFASDEDLNNEIVPCVINDIDVIRSDIKQYVSMYYTKYDTFIILPRNYAKKGLKNFSDLITHARHFFNYVRDDEDYFTEYYELNESNSTTYCVNFFHDTLSVSDYKLSNILSCVQSNLNKLGTSIKKRYGVYSGLGYMAAQKHICCDKCRHMDKDKV